MEATPSGPARAPPEAPSLESEGSRSSGNLAEAQDSEAVATCAILLPKQYRMDEGTPLWGGVKLGRLLGAGVQARVFELERSDGRPTGKVLKISHTDLGHKLLNNPVVWIGMEREWEIGTQLRAALEQPGGGLPGFMRMCDCLVRTAGEGADGRQAAFSGMIMEKLNGWEVYKRIDTPEFHNIHYVREMLFQVFSALDRAQRKLGFHHADLGMRNVMEHYPVLWEEVRESQAARRHSSPHTAMAGGASAARYETAPGALPGEAQRQATGQPPAGVVQPGSGQVRPLGPGDRCFTADGAQCAPSVAAATAPDGPEGGGAVQPWWRQATVGPGARCGMVRPDPGFSCNADGSRLPLGPHVEFKIIDFGVAVFDEQLAQVAGGYEYEEVMQRLNEVFAAKHITFGASKSSGGLEMETSTAKRGEEKRTWHLLPTAMKNRFRLRQTPAGAEPIQSAESLRAAGLPTPPDSPLSGAALAQLAEEGAAGGGDDAPQRFRSATLLRQPGQGLAHAAQLMRQSKSSGAQAPLNGGPRVAPNPQRGASSVPPIKQSAIERVYRRFWQRKGDVFHLLLNMALALDDRVWPKQDERDVQLFVTLVHHVTGVEMKASFAADGDSRSGGLFGRLACGGPPRVMGEGGSRLRDYGRWGKWQHWFRRMRIRYSAHAKPFNSGLLAGEALAAPFFGASRVMHAQLPVCVGQAFPRAA